MDLSIFFAGTAGSVPSARRGLPASLIRRGADRILIDCGEGTQRQLLRSVGLADITDVFLTHLHTDHWLGLPGMLKSFDLRDRDRPLTIHGPPGTRRLLEGLRPIWGGTGYEVTIVEPGGDGADRPRRVHDLGDPGAPPRHRLRVRARRGRAPGPLRRCARRAPRRPARAGVRRPAARRGRQRRRSRAGDRARAARPQDRPVRRHAPVRDGRHRRAPGRSAGARGDVHQRGRRPREEDGPLDRAEAATLARDAEVALLALTHLSTRYAGRELRDEARAIFPRSEVPRDFDAIEIPFPEKGAPELVRWSGAPAPAPAVPAEAARP